MMQTKQRMERMQITEQSVAFLLDQIEQLKEKQWRLQYKIDEVKSFHRSTRLELMALWGGLRDELLQDLTRRIETLERRVPDEDLTRGINLLVQEQIEQLQQQLRQLQQQLQQWGHWRQQSWDSWSGWWECSWPSARGQQAGSSSAGGGRLLAQFLNEQWANRRQRERTRAAANSGTSLPLATMSSNGN